MTSALLFLHLVSAFLFVSGAVAAGIAQIMALRRDRPSEIALLFRVARVGAMLASTAAVSALGFGLGLVAQEDLDFGAGWISASLALWLASMILGGLGGRTARRTRYLAERLAAEGDQPSAELRGLVAHRPSLLLSYASTAAVFAILVLMVWKPGA
jgi:uncharacterized membrane protein